MIDSAIWIIGDARMKDYSCSGSADIRDDTKALVPHNPAKRQVPSGKRAGTHALTASQAGRVMRQISQAAEIRVRIAARPPGCARYARLCTFTFLFMHVMMRA